MSKIEYGRLVESTDDKEYIGMVFEHCRRTGKEPVDTANGKFVRGVWHETYLYAERYYMFLFDCNGIFRLKVYAKGVSANPLDYKILLNEYGVTLE